MALLAFISSNSWNPVDLGFCLVKPKIHWMTPVICNYQTVFMSALVREYVGMQMHRERLCCFFLYPPDSHL